MAEVSNQPTTDNLNTKNGNFICGVVEGILYKKFFKKSSLNK